LVCEGFSRTYTRDLEDKLNALEDTIDEYIQKTKGFPGLNERPQNPKQKKKSNEGPQNPEQKKSMLNLIKESCESISADLETLDIRKSISENLKTLDICKSRNTPQKGEGKTMIQEWQKNHYILKACWTELIRMKHGEYKVHDIVSRLFGNHNLVMKGSV